MPIWKKLLSCLLAAAIILIYVPSLGETTHGSPDEISSAREESAASKTIKPKKLTVTGSKYVARGKKITLKAVITPDEASQKVTWKSADSKIATVSSKGVVTGKKAGKVKITATSKANPKVKKTFMVTVTAKPVTKVSVSGDLELNLADKTKVTLKAKAKPAQAAQSFTWKSSDPKVATVSDKGVVKAVSEGKAKITATATDGSGKKTTVTVEVKAIPEMEKISLDGITDKKFLQAAKEWNSLVDEVAQADKEYDQNVKAVRTAAGQAISQLESLNIQVSDSGFSLSDGETSYSLSGVSGSLEGVKVLKDQITYENGTAYIPLSNHMTLVCTESGASLTQNANPSGSGCSGFFSPRSLPVSNSLTGLAVSLIIDRLTDKLEDLGKYVNKMADEADKLVKKLEKKLEKYKDNQYLGKGTKYYRRLSAKCQKEKALRVVLKGAAKSIPAIGMLPTIHDMNESMKYLEEIKIILGHGHPTEFDSWFEDLSDLAEKLNLWSGVTVVATYFDLELIGFSLGMDVAQAIIAVAEFVPGLQLPATLALGVDVGTDFALSTLQTLMHELAGDALKRVKETDKKLHEDTGTIPIDEAHFPDPAFRQFVLDTIDKSDDNMISDREQPEIIVTYANEAKSLQGIQLFSKLRELTWQAGQLESLDISGMTTLTFVDFNSNPLKSFNASGCTSLTAFGLGNCWDLTDADISGCTGLTDFIYPGFSFSRINASNCTALKNLNCSNCKLQKLLLDGCVSLENLTCNENCFEELILPALPDLKTLNLGNDNMKTVDVSGCPALTELTVSKGTIDTLLASGCTSLNKITLQVDISHLNLSGCTALTFFGYNKHQLSDLDVSGCSSLKDLDCSNNNISKLNLSGCSGLTKLVCTTNSLGYLDCTDCINLTSIYIADNLFTSLPDGLPSSIVRIECADNKIGFLNAKQFPNLTYLFCPLNLIKTLDVSGMDQLYELSCVQKYQMISVDVRGCDNLYELYLNTPDYPSRPQHVYYNPRTGARWARFVQYPMVERLRFVYPDDYFPN